MMRVNLLCEDKTGAGLFKVIESAVQAKRAEANRAPLTFPRRPGTIDSNRGLLKLCAAYREYRFNKRPRYDHVVYIIDAYRLWDVHELGISPPLQNEVISEYLGKLTDTARTEMEQRARGADSDEEWQRISSGFHAHVLVWERESLILPVSDSLGLGPPPSEPQAVRHAAGWVKDQHLNHYGRPYGKSVQGPQLLERIARNRDLRERVLAHTPSLAAIVDELVALP